MVQIGPDRIGGKNIERKSSLVPAVIALKYIRPRGCGHFREPTRPGILDKVGVAILEPESAVSMRELTVVLLGKTQDSTEHCPLLLS